MPRPDKPARRRRRHCLQAALLALLGAALAHARQPAPEAREIVRAAMDNWRGTTSYSVITMTIHRPDWERRMTMRSWSRGDQQSLVRVTAPARDAGNATLLDDEQMWTYAPRINRIIKIPSSMMNQSWMGSDFSNKDISKSTDIIDQYDHSLLEIERAGRAHRLHHCRGAA